MGQYILVDFEPDEADNPCGHPAPCKVLEYDSGIYSLVYTLFLAWALDLVITCDTRVSCIDLVIIIYIFF